MDPKVFQAIQNNDLSNLTGGEIVQAAEALLTEYHRLHAWCAVCLGEDVAAWDGIHVDA